MKIDIDRLLAMVADAQAMFDRISDHADDVAALMSDEQPELKTRLAELRARNDADRARRRQKLQDAARS